MTAARTIAVVLCWNDAARVRALVEQLVRTGSEPGGVLVVDNGSDGDPALLLRDAPLAPRVLSLPANVGFAAAANAGIRAALSLGAEYVWLLNTDIVLGDGTLAALVAAASRDARCGMAAAMLVDERGCARGAGRVSLRTGIARHVRGTDEHYDYLCGACLLLRADMLRDVGLFDERFVFSWEEVDLCRRATERGWTMAVAADCRVVHDEGSTLGAWSRERWYHLFRGTMRYLSARAPYPRVAGVLRLSHHVATMLWHRRGEAIAGACRGFVAELRREPWHAPRSRSHALPKI